MNLARMIVGRGCAAFSRRCTTPQRNKSFVPSSMIIHQGSMTCIARSYTSKGALKDNKTPTTKLEEKIIQLERNVLSTPSKLETAQAAAAAVAMTNANVALKKRNVRKKQAMTEEELSALGFFNVNAYATAEEYDLEALLEALHKQNLYETKKFFSTDNLGLEHDVLYVTAKYPVGSETREIFFFREGSVVLWNFGEVEINNVLSFLRSFEKDSYLRPLILGESESMPYTYIPKTIMDVEGNPVHDSNYKAPSGFFQNGKFFLTQNENFLQKYTFSNAMSTSIKLGIWEATLEQYIDSMQYLTDDLKKGRRIRITRPDVLRKTGELFALRHHINLSSDLLDTPDFYWDREELESLYIQVSSYFSISRRTRVMNEKINHCLELAELVSHNLNDAHHIRLEWMIIILIMVEVGFEIVHYMDRYYNDEAVPIAH